MRAHVNGDEDEPDDEAQLVQAEPRAVGWHGEPHDDAGAKEDDPRDHHERTEHPKHRVRQPRPAKARVCHVVVTEGQRTDAIFTRSRGTSTSPIRMRHEHQPTDEGDRRAFEEEQHVQDEPRRAGQPGVRLDGGVTPSGGSSSPMIPTATRAPQGPSSTRRSNRRRSRRKPALAAGTRSRSCSDRVIPIRSRCAARPPHSLTVDDHGSPPQPASAGVYLQTRAWCRLGAEIRTADAARTDESEGLASRTSTPRGTST